MMELNEIIKTLHSFEIKILLNIDEKPYDIDEMAQKTKLNEGQTRSGVNWLEGKNLLVKDEKMVIKKFIITDKGKETLSKELIEIVIYEFLKTNKNIQINDLMEKLAYDRSTIGSAIGYMKKNNEMAQKENGLSITETFNLNYYKNFKKLLLILNEKNEIIEKALSEEDIQTLMQAQKMPLHKDDFKYKEYEIYKYKLTESGIAVQKELKEKSIPSDEISQITPEMLKEKLWKNKQFREYNIHLPAPKILIGKKHPYREFLDFLKYKFIELGFKEMEGSIVETEFWNMDALFMPQTHPARDIHDVYFVKEPKLAQSLEEPFFTNVRKTHENGGTTKSKGWGYVFDKEKARQLILRSQGTALSARQLASKPEIPGKYFSIARCFRYDKVDATHLADFYQVEGIVISEHANFPTLLGLLKTFAKEIALANEMKFVPDYFPFTEPSVELQIKHPKVGWFELGGAGIFRPEVTIPLGIEVPVIAWGLGVDRMAMMALGINDIRDLFSRDLDLIRNTRMVF